MEGQKTINFLLVILKEINEDKKFIPINGVGVFVLYYVQVLILSEIDRD